MLALDISAFFQKFKEDGIARRFDLTTQAFKEMWSPFVQIHDTRSNALGVQTESNHVDRRLNQPRSSALKKRRDEPIGRDQGPMAVNHESGIWFQADQ